MNKWYNKIKDNLRLLDYESFLFFDELFTLYEPTDIRERLFDDDEDTEMELPSIPEFDKRELLRLEKQSMGLYLSGHPMDEYQSAVKKLTRHNIGLINESVTKDENGEYIETGAGLSDGSGIILACKQKE